MEEATAVQQPIGTKDWLSYLRTSVDLVYRWYYIGIFFFFLNPGCISASLKEIFRKADAHYNSKDSDLMGLGRA